MKLVSASSKLVAEYKELSSKERELKELAYSGIDTYRNELSEISKRLDKLFGPVDLTYRMAGLDITEKASERVIMEYDRR